MTSTHALAPKGRHRVAALGAASLLVALLLASAILGVPDARAGTYVWTICRDGNAVGNGADVSNFATFSDQYATPCHTNNNNHETSVKSDQLTVGTNLTAPDGAIFTAMRINTVGNNYSYNNAWGYLYNSAGAYYRCSYYDQDFGGGTICDARGAGGFNTQIGRDYGLGTGSAFLTYGIYCRQQTGCAVGTLDQLTNELKVTVQDTSGPALSVGDQAWTSSSLHGTPNLGYSVDDSAVGGKGLVATLDGTTVADTRGADSGGCSYDNVQPCPNDDGRNVGISLASVPDGQRSMQIIAYDQLDNPSTPKTRTVLVDNQPPALIGTTTLTGKAEQGEQLTCVRPQIDGQTPTVTNAWFRSNPDGTGHTQIAGQDGGTYLQTNADIGKKISCLVTATDGGGSSSSESSITAGPFSNGATVAPGKGPQPTGITTLTSTGQNLAQPHPGDTVTIVPPRFATDPSITYSWLRCDVAGQGCVAIADATSVSYALIDADKDHRVIGQVVATDASGSTTSKSDPTGIVTAAPKGDSGTVADKTGANGPNGTDGSSSGSTTVVHLADGQLNGTNACRDAKLVARFVTGPKTTVGFGKPATLRGKLTCNANGLAIKGAGLALTARTFGRTQFIAAGAVTTDTDGQFTRVLKKGPGRQLALSYTAVGGDQNAAASAGAMMNVRGRVTLRRMSRLVKANYGAIVFKGNLYGGGIPKGFRLQLQAQDGRKWRLADTIAVKPNGNYRRVFRCKCAIPGTAYNFRVAIPSSTRLPYTPTHSQARRVRVR